MLDEPSLGLSPKFVDVVFEKLLSLRNEGLTVVMVEQKASHALGDLRPWLCDASRAGRHEGAARDLLANDDVKRLFLGEIPESLKALKFVRCLMPNQISRAPRSPLSTKPSTLAPIRARVPADARRRATTVEVLLQARRRSASGSNIQPWRVRVIAGDVKDRLTQGDLRCGRARRL